MFHMLKISWHHANGPGFFLKKKKVVLGYVELSLSSPSPERKCGLDATLAEAGLNCL